MTPKELSVELNAKISAYKLAFIARQKFQHEFSVIANDDNKTNAEYESVTENMQDANITWARLDNELKAAAENALGRGKALSDFWKIVRES